MNTKIPRVVIAATQSGSGKTTIVTGLLAALRAKGLKVQSYKIGPDYIDPGYHKLASGRPAHNLDTWLVSKEKLNEIFQKTAQDADIAVIEGVMGLYDGGKNGISSTAEIAKLLDAPVLLVINAKSMGESAAAIALGFKNYDPTVDIRGVIINRLGSPTHRSMIEEALDKLDIPAYGAIMRNDAMILPERHLGLVPVEENRKEKETVEEIGRTIAREVDIDRVIALAKSASELPTVEKRSAETGRDVKIAVARDDAFSFYYPESLAVLEEYGAEIVPFSPLKDSRLPECDGLILGGGFPEMFAKELYDNEGMRTSIREAAEAGLPIYAECGGFMYLMKRMIDFEKNAYPMLGIVPGEVEMNRKLQTVGYVSATMHRDTVLGKKGTVLHGHEFHFSSECAPAEGVEYPRAFEFVRTRKKEPYDAGYASGNILGSYLHLHFAGCPQAAEHFVETCRAYKNREA
ncbi:cobyrinate a,c-diamide synthase [Schwartzia sp. (in: firmicutes)]|nr:cobyrinate a,c-diamide synthase [Schwartzia sp. (in: firmicutes)]